MNYFKTISTLASVVMLVGCSAMMTGSSEPSREEITQLLKSSFAEKGAAKLDRLDQSELQQACSTYATTEMPKELKAKLEKAADEAVKYPADGQFLGDWREGERIAQNGRGLQFSDAPNTVGGGNCYACHAIDKKELSFAKFF